MLVICYGQIGLVFGCARDCCLVCAWHISLCLRWDQMWSNSIIRYGMVSWPYGLFVAPLRGVGVRLYSTPPSFRVPVADHSWGPVEGPFWVPVGGPFRVPVGIRFGTGYGPVEDPLGALSWALVWAQVGYRLGACFGRKLGPPVFTPAGCWLLF